MQFEVMFVDLAWGGRAGEVRYPPFLNPKMDRGDFAASSAEDGDAIQQEHDSFLLRNSINRWRRHLESRRRPTSMMHAYAQTHSMPCACAQRGSSACRTGIQNHPPMHTIPVRRQSQTNMTAKIWRRASYTAASQACSFAL